MKLMNRQRALKILFPWFFDPVALCAYCGKMRREHWFKERGKTQPHPNEPTVFDHRFEPDVGV